MKHFQSIVQFIFITTFIVLPTHSFSFEAAFQPISPQKPFEAGDKILLGFVLDSNHRELKKFNTHFRILMKSKDEFEQNIKNLFPSIFKITSRVLPELSVLRPDYAFPQAKEEKVFILYDPSSKEIRASTVSENIQIENSASELTNYHNEENLEDIGTHLLSEDIKQAVEIRKSQAEQFAHRVRKTEDHESQLKLEVGTFALEFNGRVIKEDFIDISKTSTEEDGYISGFQLTKQNVKYNFECKGDKCKDRNNAWHQVVFESRTKIKYRKGSGEPFEYFDIL